MQILADHDGRHIRLTDERLRHIHEHPEMAGLDAAIAETLAEPEQVIESVSDPQMRLYYRPYSRTPVGAKWLCIVVKIAANDAFIVTAYLTDRPKRGNVLWSRGR